MTLAQLIASIPAAASASASGDDVGCATILNAPGDVRRPKPLLADRRLTYAGISRVIGRVAAAKLRALVEAARQPATEEGFVWQTAHEMLIPGGDDQGIDLADSDVLAMLAGIPSNVLTDAEKAALTNYATWFPSPAERELGRKVTAEECEQARVR